MHVALSSCQAKSLRSARRYPRDKVDDVDLAAMGVAS